MTSLRITIAATAMAAFGACTSNSGPGPTGQCPPATGAGTKHSSTISADETWHAADSPHIIPVDISVRAKLTIEPCSTIQLAPGVTVTSGGSGAIVGEGTASQPIDIDAEMPGQPWASFSTDGGTIRLAYTVVTGGGMQSSPTSAAFQGKVASVSPLQVFSFDHVTIKGSAGIGVSLAGATSFDPASTDLTITGSALVPIFLQAQSLSSVPTGTYTGNGSDAILVGAGINSTINFDTTIHARGVPYQIGLEQSTAELRVGGGNPAQLATLTIEPGVTLRFAKNGLIAVEHAVTDSPASGALVAAGTDASPIVFSSAQPAPAPGDWVGIVFGSHPAPSDKLDHVRIEFAGAKNGTIAGCPLNTEAQAALQIIGYAPAASFLTASTIADSQKDGIFLGWVGPLVDFSAGNTFTNVPNCHETSPPSMQGVCPPAPSCAN
jgi:hypothetical protein